LGLRVTVNTDNRLITDTTVSKELWLAHTKMRIPFKDIKAIILAGFKSSFLPFHEKQALMRRAAADLDCYNDITGELQKPLERPARSEVDPVGNVRTSN
jgi:adenosine deaminase